MEHRSSFRFSTKVSHKVGNEKIMQYKGGIYVSMIICYIVIALVKTWLQSALQNNIKQYTVKTNDQEGAGACHLKT